MKCPFCNAEIADRAASCPNCGTTFSDTETRRVPNASVGIKTAKTAGNAGILLGNAARKARMVAAVDPDEIVSDRVYNGTIIAVLFWGLLVNYLMCRYIRTESLVSLVENPLVFFIGYFVLAFGGIILAAKSHNPILSFLGYNMVVVPFGVVISIAVSAYGGLESQVVTYAFLYTMLITIGMMACFLIAPDFFSKIGGMLSAVLIGLVLCELILLLIGVKQNVIDWVAAGLFSLYIGYDIYRSQQFPKTIDNAVDSALDIYLDIANLFIRILSILGKRKD